MSWTFFGFISGFSVLLHWPICLYSSSKTQIDPFTYLPFCNYSTSLVSLLFHISFRITLLVAEIFHWNCVSLYIANGGNDYLSYIGTSSQWICYISLLDHLWLFLPELCSLRCTNTARVLLDLHLKLIGWCFVFLWKGRVKERQISHPLVYHTNACNSWGLN